MCRLEFAGAADLKGADLGWQIWSGGPRGGAKNVYVYPVERQSCLLSADVRYRSSLAVGAAL